MEGVKSEAKQLLKDNHKLEKEVTVLKDQLAIHKQQLKTLGKRTVRAEPEEA